MYFFGFFSNNFLQPSQQKKKVLFLCSKVVARSLSNSIPHTGSTGTIKKKIIRYLFIYTLSFFHSYVTIQVCRDTIFYFYVKLN
jgi:hypothetical protein